ncbi:MAG TPA: sugar phosphate isomerase/epimerase [Candidatus Sumerlaeota bacterium]|nr:MAG: Xylose isomerase-like TIM barrel [candidate division BRC1 bacterium ADurb.BinA292]HOE96876.1 sugar phosphate isomerase/epimerase [Candidatus Sumerlaeota bacterium]HOR29171.1 sugar phosphate isomerase/epimerase [Candidatus Sumerlaeota bacterium]HPK00962.1 sugar phosphate isomerase/epimerase [Candidatus Sumerlaeota bacterium]
MQLRIYHSFWGMTGSTQSKIEAAAMAGYDGIESALAPDLPIDEYRGVLSDHKMDFIAAMSAVDGDELARQVESLLPLKPTRMRLHAGRDCMSREEGKRYFARVLALQEEIGMPILIETHRGRMFYSPWDALYYMKEFPALRVNADFSHWVNVCERLPDDQEEAMALACERSLHIHARVGYEEGPQVPDPAAPEAARYLEWHLKQWDRIRKHHEERGEELLTVTPEFGPPPYLHTLPYTNVPVADLWSVCLWMANQLRERWKDIAG